MKLDQWVGPERDPIIVGSKLVYVAVPASIGLLSYAYWNHENFFAILGAGLLVSIASLVVGALTGFLFGIPKSGAPVKQVNEGRGDGNTKLSVGPTAGLRRNTNIEEISDWLTKIIVGLGIYELKNVPSLFARLSAFLSPAFGGKYGSGAIAVTLALAFAASGFLLGYLLTVLFITQAIVRADPSLRADENLAQDAKSAKLVLTVAGDIVGGKVPPNIRDQVISLARRYERERASRPPGPERTAAMEEVTREMRQLALVAYPMIDELSDSNLPGERLAAIAFLQIKPDAGYLDWLAERISYEKPFARFQAALALRNATRSLSQEHRAALQAAIDKAKRALELEKATDTDEYAKIVEADKEIK
jgi:hypothetical protein